MAICRVFLPKSSLLIYRIGFSTVKVGFCSSLCSNSDSAEALQLTEDAGEPKRGVTAEPEPFIKENEAMLGANQPRIYHNIDASTNVNYAAAMSIESNNMPGHESYELHVKSVTKSQDAATFSEQNTSLRHRMPFMIGANSDDVVNSEVLEVNQMHDFPYALASESGEDLGSHRGILSAVYEGPETSIRLSDIFKSYKDKQEKRKGEEALSNVIFDSDRNKMLKSQHSPSYDLLPERASADLNDDVIEEFPITPCNQNPQEHENVGSEVGESSSLSDFTQKIFDSENVDMRSVSEQIIEENVKPTSLSFSPFEHSDEPCEEDAEKLADIKGLIDFIKFHKGVHSNAEIDNKCADLITENLSDSKSYRSPYKDQLTSSDFATAKPEIECEGTNVFEAIQSLDTSETKETSDIQNRIKDTCPRRFFSNLFDSGSNSDSLRSVHGGRLTLLDSMTAESRMQDEEICQSDVRSFDCRELKSSVEIPNSERNGEDNLKNRLLSTTKLNENKMLVRFLRKNVTESEILQTFQSYGKISKIEVSSGGFFGSAYIYFEEREGLLKAMKQTEIIVKYGVIIMESATLKADMKEKLSVPCLIRDPDVPMALIKNPTRTLKIQHLTSDMSLRHFEEALSFCNSNISGCFFGTSNSSAFIEFETEVGKETALAKHTINVLGRQLVMLRIDVPRTTVARISNFETSSNNQITSLCQSVGAVRIPNFRCPGVLDAHYKLSEWPNMCNILNRLNGFEVEGRRLRAEPAPVFPPDILSAVWHQKEERIHLKTAGIEVCRRLRGKMLGGPELASLEHIWAD